MRDFITINNYSGIGTIGFSRASIAAVASAALKEVEGVTIFAKGWNNPFDPGVSGVHVIFTKEGKASIRLDVNLSRGVSVPESCEKIQSAVATAVTQMCDVVPFDVQVKVMRLV